MSTSRYEIRFIGDENSLIASILRDFGNVAPFDPKARLSGYDILVVDCAEAKGRVDDSFCKSVFDTHMRLLLLNISDAELDVLAQPMGRRIDAAGRHLFVRALPYGRPEGKFSFRTICGHDPEQIESLRREMVNLPAMRADDSQTFSPWPSPAAWGLYPDNVSMLFGSWSELWSENVSSPVGAPSGETNLPYAQSVQVDMYAFAYLANGENGDGNYYVIICTRLSNPTPDAVWCIGNPGGGWNADTFSYGLSVAPTPPSGGSFTAYGSAPTSGTVGVIQPYGQVVQTNFAVRSEIAIKVQENGSWTTLNFTPTYSSGIGQYTFPTIFQYEVDNSDDGTKNEVDFNMMNSAGDGGGGTWTPGPEAMFDAVSYFTFTPIAGATSYPVVLNIGVNFVAKELACVGLGCAGNCMDDGTQDYPRTVTKTISINLINLTLEQPWKQFKAPWL